MDRDELIELLTTEDIVKIMQDLGSTTPKKDHQGNLYFQTICHGGDKHKLHYFIESKMFMCYTNCGSMSIFDVIMQSKYCDFKDAYKYLTSFKGVSNKKTKHKGLKINNDNNDLEFLDRHLYKQMKIKNTLPHFNENILNIFDEYYPSSWCEEGIKPEIAKEFNISFYFNQGKCIIPHYDINNKLVGIRGRNFFEDDIDAGKKYIPVTIQGLTYRYPTRFNLYGINKNKETIKRVKKVILFESEKSVMLYGSYYGQENNIALATMGMNLTAQQRELLIETEVSEVIIAWDKQYQIEFLEEEYLNTKEYKEFVLYIKKIKKAVEILINYFNVSVIFCWDNRIEYKDAPIDKGKEIFESLLSERELIYDVEELEELYEI